MTTRDLDEGFKPITHHKQEEDYFYKQDQELIRSLREKANRVRGERQATEQKKLHWMRCPKCGGSMDEITVASLCIDRCSDCRGVYFDDGELEILDELQSNGGVAISDVVARIRAM